MKGLIQKSGYIQPGSGGEAAVARLEEKVGAVLLLTLFAARL